MIKATQHDSNIIENNCKYYTSEELRNELHCKKSTQTRRNDFRLIHLNIRSLDKNWAQLMGLLNTIDANFDVIALSETGRKNIENREAQLKHYGYKMLVHKPTQIRGGAALIYKSDLDITEREDLKILPECKGMHIENVWMEIKLGSEPSDKTIVGCIYKHPGGSINNVKNFRHKIEHNLISINKENKQCLITGDLNIDGLKIKSNNEVENFFNMLLEHNFLPTITCPTRIVNNPELHISLIDHIIISSQIVKHSTKIQSGNIYSDISDHLPNFIIVEKGNSKKSKHKRPMIRILGDKNRERYHQLLKNANWNAFYESEDVNTALKVFYEIHNQAFNIAFPMRQLSRKRAKDKKWMTSGLRKSINHKNYLYKLSITKPSTKNTEKYKIYKNRLTKCLKQAEEIYYMNIIESEKKNLKNMWDTIGHIINPHKMRRQTTIKKLIINNDEYSENKAIANKINEYFSTVGENLAGKFKTTNSYKTYIKDRIPNSFYLTPTTVEETLREISKLDTNKAGGDDNLKPSLVKENKDILADKITFLINLSFKTGDVPDKLKLAKVIPIFKKNNRHDPNNYRPISLLSVINKLMEKLMFKRISKFIEKYNILYEYQFGFRKDHSTTLAIMEIHENIINTLVKGSYIAGLYLDLSKAFDTVDHEILVSKLEHYGIRGPPLKWFHSYLKNRTQYTLANGTKSDVRNINYGVPQGSVLGPLLFLLYTNDMPNCLPESHKTRLFADDSNIFITSQSPYTLKNELKTAIGRILRWLEDNKLTVNLNKTQYSIFQTKNMNIPDWLNNIKINNNTIKRVHSARFLGIILDEKLKWDDHVKQLSESLTQIINAFKIIKNYVPEDKKRMLYYAYIYSRIQYGIEMYGTASKKLIKKVQTKQNRAIKVLHNKNFYTPTTQLHKELRYPLVKDIEKINVCKFVHKQRNNKTPKIFNDLFTENKDKHKYNTRQSQNLATPLAATNFSQKTIDFRGPRTWNSIPMKIRKLECNKHFGKKLRAHLIDKLT